MNDLYDRALRAAMRYTGWALLCWVCAILLLAAYGYFFSQESGAQPSYQQNSVTMCPTGVFDANNNPVVVACYTTMVAIAATGTTGAVTATMPAVAGKTNWVCGFAVSAVGGTATVSPITINNLIGNVTFTFQFASTAAGATLTQGFTPCVPAKAVNTTVAVATTADGTASAVDVNVWGYVQ